MRIERIGITVLALLALSGLTVMAGLAAAPSARASDGKWKLCQRSWAPKDVPVFSDNYGQTDVWALRGQTCGTATRFARRYAFRDAGGQLDGWRQERSWKSATDVLETTFRKGRTRVLLILYVCNDDACEEWG